MSVLPKPPPIPRLCPHSQSKIITLYYRLQTGPVNILPLGCTQSRGMHLKGCSLLRISTQQCTPACRVFKNSPLGCQKFETDQQARLKGGPRRRCRPEMARMGDLGLCATTGTNENRPHSNFKMSAVVATSSLMNSPHRAGALLHCLHSRTPPDLQTSYCKCKEKDN